MMNVPLIRCASHRFNLAVQDVMKSYVPIITKIQSIMIELLTLQNAAKFRTLTNLRARLNNETRWSPTYAILGSFPDLMEHLPLLGVDEIDKLLPNAVECRKIDTLIEQMKQLDSVTKDLQRDDITMAGVPICSTT